MSWTRLTVMQVCGKCVEMIPAGEPVLRWQMPSGTVKWRCATCALHEGERPPADLEQAPATTEPTKPVQATSGLTRIGSLSKVLPFDWRAKASGE